MSDEQMGVYAIVNRADAAVYIGSSIHLKERLRQHEKELIKGTHPNRGLRQACQYFSPDAFNIVVLQTTDHAEHLPTIEQYWMDFYRGEGTTLYNTVADAKLGAAARTIGFLVNLRAIRECQGLTIEELARRCGAISPAVLQYYEDCGEKTRLGLLQELARALGIEPRDLLGPAAEQQP